MHTVPVYHKLYWIGVVMAFKNRKAAENVVASLILFIAVMALATATTVVFKNYLDRSSSAVNEQQSRSVDVMRTNFFIPLASYDAGITRVYVKNTGSTRFAPDDMDVYIDGIRIPRDPANRTITIVEDTDNTNPGIWDPGEEIEIEIFKPFSTSQTRTVLVTAPNGVSAREEFSS